MPNKPDQSYNPGYVQNAQHTAQHTVKQHARHLNGEIVPVRQHQRGGTFVDPDPDPMPPAPLPPLPLADLAPLDVDPAALYSRGPQLRATATTTPMAEATAFLVKYAGLTIILAILAAGLTWQLAWHPGLGIIAFGVAAILGYWGLAALDHGYTAPGVERHRLSQGTRVLLRQIDAQREIELTRLQLERSRLDYQQQVNHTLAERYRYKAERQLARHPLPAPPAPRPPTPIAPITTSAPSPDGGGLGRGPSPSPTENGIEIDLLADHLAADHPAPGELGHTLPDPALLDPARAAILDGLRDAYNAADPQGYIARHHVLPWSTRAAGSRQQRARMLALIHASGIATFDDATRLWRLDRRRYPTPHAAADGLAGVL